MKRWTMLPAFFLMATVVLAQNAGDGTNSVAIGDITKIDLKGKSITINNAVSYNIAPAVGGGARGGAGRGGGGSGSRGGRRGGGGGGFIPQAPRSFKVVISKAEFKEDDHEINFSDLKLGDHIQVLGQTKGSKIEATEVVRKAKDNTER